MSTPTKKKGPSTGELLRRRGFDYSEYIRRGPDESYWRVGCSQCEACCVNGVPVHETGCPNQVRDD